MQYERFEALPVWQSGSEQARRIFALVEKPPWRRHGSLRDQCERAALSVSNNVAEGFKRGTTIEQARRERETFLEKHKAMRQKS